MFKKLHEARSELRSSMRHHRDDTIAAAKELLSPNHGNTDRASAEAKRIEQEARQLQQEIEGRRLHKHQVMATLTVSPEELKAPRAQPFMRTLQNTDAFRTHVSTTYPLRCSLDVNSRKLPVVPDIPDGYNRKRAPSRLDAHLEARIQQVQSIVSTYVHGGLCSKPPLLGRHRVATPKVFLPNNQQVDQVFELEDMRKARRSLGPRMRQARHMCPRGGPPRRIFHVNSPIDRIGLGRTQPIQHTQTKLLAMPRSISSLIN